MQLAAPYSAVEPLDGRSVRAYGTARCRVWPRAGRASTGGAAMPECGMRRRDLAHLILFHIRIPYPRAAPFNACPWHSPAPPTLPGRHAPL